MTDTAVGNRDALDALAGLTRTYSAHNYHPLPVVVSTASGVWVTDVAGQRYLDMLAGYSALNFGHLHPRLVDAAVRQLSRVTLVSRAFDHDVFGPFCAELADLCGMEMVLPMNSGAEAVETSIKVARKWGYLTRGVPHDDAVIIVFDGNFHGRTTTIVSFSSDAGARDDFGPYTPGFVSVPYGDLAALRSALSSYGERVVAVLIEPIQGEAGVVVPPPGFLAGVRSLCTSAGALMIADEIQSGLGRVGATFACAAEGVVPDAYLLGKALGGGIVPVSAMVSSRSVLGVLRPGQHGSTFGGNPLACAVGREVIAMLRTGEYQERSAALGTVMHARLTELTTADTSRVSGVTGRGLWAGVTLDGLDGRAVCERLAELGVLAKETHGSTIRLAPPLVITEDELSWGLERFEEAASGLAQLGAATVALGQVFLLGPPYAVVAGLADDRSRAGYLAAYGTCWGIAQTLGPLAWTRLLSIGVPAAWLTGAALCVLLAALVPFAGRAVTMAERRLARETVTA